MSGLKKNYEQMYINKSTSKDYPKTLIIRNHEGGMIWQLYHIEKESEAKKLSQNAHANGFQAITLENHQSEEEETFKDWRETTGGKKNNQF